MVLTNKQKDKTEFWNKCVKIKSLQKLGEALVIVLPKYWLESLNWTRETNVVLRIDPYSEEIILSKLDKDKNLILKSGKKTGEPITIDD